MRPILRPGTHVLRRGNQELQIGLDPRRAVILPDDPQVRSCLELLSRSADAGEYDAPALLELLAANDLLLDGGALMPLIPGCREDRPGRGKRRPVPRAAVCALARSTGDDAAGALAARTRTRALVGSFGNGAGAGLADELAGLLREAGLRLAATGGYDLAAVVGVGEPQREVADGWMRTGTPHLPVRLSEGAATVGPFVVPGVTACLRCVDAHHTDADPAWPLLVTQYASATAGSGRTGFPNRWTAWSPGSPWRGRRATSPPTPRAVARPPGRPPSASTPT